MGGIERTVKSNANELQTRDVDSAGGVDYTLAHDAVGNMTDDGEADKYIYDAWGRLRQVNNQSNDPISQHCYNGLNWRIDVMQVKDGAVVLATYLYNGVGHVVDTSYDKINLLSSRASGSTFPQWDNYNRPVATFVKTASRPRNLPAPCSRKQEMVIVPSFQFRFFNSTSPQ